MSITADAASIIYPQQNTGMTLGSTTSADFTVGSGLNRLLIVHVHVKSNVRRPSGVTYNGVAMTLAGQIINASSNGPTLDMWALVNPDVGLHSVTVTWNGTGTVSVGIGASSWFGIHQAVPYGAQDSTASGASAGNGLKQMTVTSEDGGLVLDTFGQDQRASSNTTIGGSQLQVIDSAAAIPSLESSKQLGAAPTVTMSWTITTSTLWAGVAIPLHAAVDNSNTGTQRTLTGAGA